MGDESSFRLDEDAGLNGMTRQELIATSEGRQAMGVDKLLPLQALPLRYHTAVCLKKAQLPVHPFGVHSSCGFDARFGSVGMNDILHA